MRCMRLAAVLIMVLVVTPAFADEPKVDEWVGTWSGKATSTGCSDTIPKKLALDVSVSASGALSSNGDAIIEGLGDLPWTSDGTRLVLGARRGVTASLKRDAASIKLFMATDAGCIVKATLKRPTSGIASCDRVRALATIKAQCGAGETLAEVEASWAAWSKLKGKKKKAQATACTEQAASLESEVSCAAVPGTTGLRECDVYVALMNRYLECDKVPKTAREGARKGLDAMNSSWGDTAGMPDDAKEAANEACRQAADALKQGAKAMGCPL